MKKLLSLISAISFGVITTTNVVACDTQNDENGDGNNNNGGGEDTEKIELSKALGTSIRHAYTKDEDQLPAKDVLYWLKEAVTDLVIEEISVKSLEFRATQGWWAVYVMPIENSKVYKLSETYSKTGYLVRVEAHGVGDKQNLEKLIKVWDLGEIKRLEGENEVTLEQVTNKADTLNPEAKIEWSDLTLNVIDFGVGSEESYCVVSDMNSTLYFLPTDIREEHVFKFVSVN